MFVNNLLNSESKNVSVIGKIEKIDNDIVFLKCGDHEIMVKHNGLDSYKTSLVRVKGIVENGILIEHIVHEIPDSFDMNMFNKFVDVCGNYEMLF